MKSYDKPQKANLVFHAAPIKITTLTFIEKSRNKNLKSITRSTPTTIPTKRPLSLILGTDARAQTDGPSRGRAPLRKPCAVTSLVAVLRERRERAVPSGRRQVSGRVTNRILSLDS
ncbi:hypothetical protein EVAR_37671_1 [Eumeta japonica]|uniref:Uncharacterized protein n=1 Tax=Eumeta variegata TaxID=151549 RepID=A0A4C1Z1T9_EUMVA|nr:hypothetical protein EVAR_37671_1 [Eumeta japonica]